MQRMFGPVMQNGFVVPDLEAAIDHWVSVMHVGPFFLLAHIPFVNSYFRGRPLDIDISVAIAYSGDIQIELIEQHNDAPSIYAEFTQQGRYGLQHMGIMTDSVADHLARLEPLGIRPVQHGATAAGAKFAYLDTDVTPGFMIELIESNAMMVGAFRTIYEAAQNWDGKERVRSFG
jgi:Glyoxalase/Bleomycin resistance protein/Dioxygenase superfamily